MVLDLDGEVIAKKVLLFYNRWAIAAVMGRIWVAKIHISDMAYEGHGTEGEEGKLVTWTPARARVKAELRCISRPVT